MPSRTHTHTQQVITPEPDARHTLISSFLTTLPCSHLLSSKISRYYPEPNHSLCSLLALQPIHSFTLAVESHHIPLSLPFHSVHLEPRILLFWFRNLENPIDWYPQGQKVVQGQDPHPPLDGYEFDPTYFSK